MGQKFTYTKLTVPLNSLENSRKLCHGFRSFSLANWHNLSQLEEYLWMYFKVYLQSQCLFAWHHGKIKINQPSPQKTNCIPPQVWFIFGHNFQMPDGTTFISTQVQTSRDLKKRVWARRPTNLTQLHQRCQEEWAKIHPTYCGKLVEGYLKCLTQVKKFKGNVSKY